MKAKSVLGFREARGSRKGGRNGVLGEELRAHVNEDISKGVAVLLFAIGWLSPSGIPTQTRVPPNLKKSRA